MKSFRNPWWIVFGSVLGLMVSNVTMLQFSMYVLMKPITTDFGWPRTVPSAAVGLSQVWVALACPFLGRLIDLYGIKKVYLTSITLFCLATAAMPLAPANAVILVAMFSLAGFFGSGQSPLPYAKSIAVAFDRQRKLALGLAMSGVGVGAALMPVLTQQYLHHFGWRGAFMALALTVFVIAIPAVALLARAPSSSNPKAVVDNAIPLAGTVARDVMGSRNFWLLAFVFTCLPIVANAIFFHLVALLTDRGIAPDRAVHVFAAVAPALIAGRLLCGLLLDRFSAPRVALVFIILPAVGVLLILADRGASLISAGSILVGLGLGAEVDLIAYLQSRYYGLRAFGQVYGYLFGIFTVGAGIGPFLMDTASDLTGSYRRILIGFLILLGVAAAATLDLARPCPYPVEPRI